MEIVKYDITDAAIAEMESIYMALTITDIDDKEQFDAVHSARMTVKGKRVEVEKRRKELKADALEWGKKVDTEAKRIFGKLEPIEYHLDREEKKVTDEQKRIKEEADRKQKEKIEARLLALSKVNCNLPFFDVAGMTDDEYEDRLRKAAEAYLAKQKRLADEEAARRAESERLEAIRKEQDIKAKQLIEADRLLKEATAKIEAEKKALEDAKRAEKERKDREAFEIKAKEEARIAAEKAAKDKIEREAREAKEKAERESANKARQEALRPDKDRLILYGKALMDVPKPELKDKAAKEILGQASGALYQILKNISKKVEEL